MKNLLTTYILHICLAVLFLSKAEAQFINEYIATNTTVLQDYDGETGDWIELYNDQSSAINLTGYSLSDNIDIPQKWIFPTVEIPAYSYLVIWASGKDMIAPNQEIHTNFKIKSQGEAIYFYDAEQVLLDETPSLPLGVNISYGRTTSDLINWYYFEQPTPGEANFTVALAGQAQLPIFSHEGGFYQAPVTLELTVEHPSDTIRYTLDGSLPTENSSSYSFPINIQENTSLRVKVYRYDALPSAVTTNTYLFDDDVNLRVVCLSTAPSNLFGDTGIYENYASGQERPIHLEYYEKDKTLGFELDMGIKIHAPDVREQRSLRLYARSEYGTKAIDYKIFDDKDINRFKRLILRNGGNDNLEKKKSQVRDIFVHQLYQAQNPENGMASFQQVHVYINGEYWGIYNLRERQDEYYMESNFGYKKEEVDFLEYDYAEPNKMKTISGDWENWEALKTYLIDEDISNPTHYQTIEQWMDIDNFIDYQIYEIFVGNQDWLNNNIKFWRPKTVDGKWRWVLWDTDYGLGSQKNVAVGKPDFNFLNMAYSWGGWGNGDWTWILRNLFTNDVFVQKFTTRYLDLLNTSFLPTYCTESFDQLAEVIAPDVHKQFAQWGASQLDWQVDLDYTKDFLTQRPFYCRKYLAKRFELDSILQQIELDVSDTIAGNIQVNTIFIDQNTLGWQNQPYPWTGKYFKNYEVQVQAIAKEGYLFLRWEGDIESMEPSLNVVLSDNTYLKAIFTPSGTIAIPPLFINEVMADNESAYPDESGNFEDWIEIYNAGAEAINLGGLYLTDDATMPLKWEIPADDSTATTIPSGGHLVFFADKSPENGPLHVDFKLKKEGEFIGIFHQSEFGEITPIDTLTFPALEENISFGRLPDGGPDWVTFDIPTPNATNQIIIGTDDLTPKSSLISLYPNPTSGTLYIKIEGKIQTEYWLEVTDLNGRTVHSNNHFRKGIYQFDTSNLTSGVYIFSIKHAGMAPVHEKVLITN